MEYLSQHLRAMRAAHGMTQQSMATALGIDQSTYSRIERGKENVNLASLTAIANEFGLQPHELLEMAKNPPYPPKK